MRATWLRGFVALALAGPLTARAADVPTTYAISDVTLKLAVSDS